MSRAILIDRQSLSKQLLGEFAGMLVALPAAIAR
jgi:hypothetical protein